MHRYKTFSGAMPTTAALAKIATGTTIKTILQVAPPATRQMQLIAWGFSYDAPPGAAGQVELIQTDVAATVTAHVAAGIIPLDPNAPASLVGLGAALSGYNGSAEGAITATRLFDEVQLPSTASGAILQQYAYQFMPDERPIIAVSKFLRVRAITPTTGVNMAAWAVWDE